MTCFSRRFFPSTVKPSLNVITTPSCFYVSSEDDKSKKVDKAATPATKAPTSTFSP